MSNVTDPVFGEMVYKHGWNKRQRIMLWGTIRDLRIKATAYKGDEINQSQRDSYKRFSENLAAMSARSLELLADYLKKNNEKCDYDTIKEQVTPRSILFKRDGSYGILCDYTQDEEHGLAISLYPTEEAGIQDFFI